jgi:HEAT repeat protein
LIKGDVDESYLKELPLEKLPRTILSSDKRKEGAVIALGSVALHLNDETNVEKIDSTLEMLIAALKTPSEDVQASVTESLSKLMKKGRIPDRIESLISQLIEDCLNGSSYAIRRGAAYGISAIVKGSGISCLKKYDLVKKLEVACTSGSPNAKEGSLCAIELLCSRLGLLFEPYVIVLLPALLKAFGDSNDYVRNAASTTAGLIMSKLSSHGVKLVMPAILDAFDEQEWRTKQASIMMLGAMSQLAPNQLASSLPKIVPKLSEAFADTHPKVKASAEQSFREITKVIKNPEIASLSTILVHALTDPSNETKGALEALIETEFLHTIDAPSLALIVPVVYRGLRDRSASSKRYAALIAGNMCTMISDPRDLNPYIQTLLPGLKLALLDPIPDVRSTAAKALGSLARGLGESSIPDLRPWLISVLKGDTETSVERSGAAQGLIEVLMACGHQVVDSVMLEDIFPLIRHPKAGTREGALWVLQFLPLSLGQSFVPLIDASLPVLLSGLADDHESVRYVALRAGRVLIRCHGKAHSDTILPSLEEGLCDSDWHIRLSSITLLGDLLSMIGGTKVVTGDADTQEDIRQAERAQAQLALTLGASTRKRVLSRVYIARSDSAVVVRQMAVQVWKTVVSVTGRTLRDILQTLVSHIVLYLASGDHERTEVGGRCLGDVVNKLGDAVLPEIVPVLRDSFYRGDVFTRKGACVGLSEVISSSTKEHINKFLDIIIKAVQDALCDDDEGVRKMASGCFQNLYSLVGPKALDEVLPALLVAMRDDSGEAEKERAIQGLIGILSVRSRELLPFLIPRLVSKPVSISRAKALGTISLVTKSTIISHLSSIIPSLIFELSEFSQSSGCDRRELAIRDCARSICSNVDAEGINTVVSEIASKCSNDKYSIRMESCWMLGILVEQSK